MNEVRNMLPPFLPRFEFWAASALLVLAMFTLGIDEPTAAVFQRSGYGYAYYENYFWPLLCQYLTFYLGFLLLQLRVVPMLLQRQQVLLQAGCLVLSFLLIGLICSIAETYPKAYLFKRMSADEVYKLCFQEGYVMALVFFLFVGFYNVIRYFGQYLLTNRKEVAESRQVAFRDGYVAFLLWLLVLMLLVAVRADALVLRLWGVPVLYSIALYCFSFYRLLPLAIRKKRPLFAYLWRVTLIVAVSFLPLMLLGMLLTDDEDDAAGLALANSALQMLVMVPLTWVLFKRHVKRNAEMYVLKNELGQSNANLDFLRSQINPHFLFNTLNTLYGTALQENSERTAQGIQMLGDMMRFMLHENHQHKILLSREIEYMRNYIELQSLRTSASPDIGIQTKIEEVLDEKFIAPMLLIPFVENAFKHGISLSANPGLG